MFINHIKIINFTKLFFSVKIILSNGNVSTINCYWRFPMNNIKRVFVEKKPEFNIESRYLLEDIKTNLGITEIQGVRVLNRYDVEHISEQVYNEALYTIFSEASVDFVYEENFLVEEDEKIFAVEYLPGQYDQRADSCEQCIQILEPSENTIVRTAKIFVIKGVSAENLEKIKKYCINPVDSREATLEKPATLELNYEVPSEVENN